MLTAAPPHTRGSTARSGGDGQPAPGSPAHAGIDPNRWWPKGCRRWLPRTRGDRPVWVEGGSSWLEAPPHTRGSTARSAKKQGKSVDNLPPAPPHTRGSTAINQIEPCSGTGSPAHAGIDPNRWWPKGCRRWLPRTRGDRPVWVEGGSSWLEAPPHTRGSTAP